MPDSYCEYIFWFGKCQLCKCCILICHYFLRWEWYDSLTHSIHYFFLDLFGCLFVYLFIYFEGLGFNCQIQTLVPGRRLPFSATTSQAVEFASICASIQQTFLSRFANTPLWVKEKTTYLIKSTQRWAHENHSKCIRMSVERVIFVLAWICFVSI